MTQKTIEKTELSFLRENNLFIFFFFLLWSAAFFYLFKGGERGDLIQFFAQYRSPYMNQFFGICTNLGEAYGYILAIIGFLFIAYSKSIAFLLNALFVLLFSGSLKWLFGHERPVRYFNDLIKSPDVANYIAEVHLHQGWTTSFPSGHTTAAFAFFSLLAFFIPQQVFKIVCLMLAVLVAFSRIYMVQHFLKDITSGMITGFCIALVVFVMHQKIAERFPGRLSIKKQ
jgi:membrane-associated phospholipid phosphatase